LDHTRLGEGIETALRQSRLVDHPLASQLAWLRPSLEIADPVVNEVVSVLRLESVLTMFDGQMQVFVGMAHRQTYEDLARWLVGRAHEVGSTQVVVELERYVTEANFLCTQFAVLTGIAVSEATDLGSGIQIVPFDSLPVWRRQFIEAMTSRGPFPARPGLLSALTTEIRVPRTHVPSAESIPEGRDEDLRDSCRVLTLIGPCAPMVTAMWVDPQPDVACASTAAIGISFPRVAVNPFATHVTLNAEAVAEAASLHRQFFGLSAALKQHLRVPLDRLNSALRQVGDVPGPVELEN